MTTPVVHQRRLKEVIFILDGISHQCQLDSWTVNNNTDDGTKTFTYCPDSEFRTETNYDYSLALKFYADWRFGGISDLLWRNDRVVAAFQIDHYPTIIGEHVRWSGTCRIRTPNVGGDVMTTEQTSVTLPVFGKPVYARIG